MTILFVTGIDTEVGKTVACGVLAKTLLNSGLSVYTQKLVETGCKDGISHDLLEHQRIVGRQFNDKAPELHSPYRFKTPVSPHLAAEMDGQAIDIHYLSKQMSDLSTQCQHLLVEGAGGLYVPLIHECTILDFIIDHGLPIILVTSPRLGSINHTLLSLAVCLEKKIDVRAIIYNHYPQVDSWMVDSTRSVIQNYIKQNFNQTIWLELLSDSEQFEISFNDAEKLLF